MFLFYSIGEVYFAFDMVLELSGSGGVGQGGNPSSKTQQVQLGPHVTEVTKLHARWKLDILYLERPKQKADSLLYGGSGNNAMELHFSRQQWRDGCFFFLHSCCLTTCLGGRHGFMQLKLGE